MKTKKEMTTINLTTTKELRTERIWDYWEGCYDKEDYFPKVTKLEMLEALDAIYKIVNLMDENESSPYGFTRSLPGLGKYHGSLVEKFGHRHDITKFDLANALDSICGVVENLEPSNGVPTDFELDRWEDQEAADDIWMERQYNEFMRLWPRMKRWIDKRQKGA